MRLMVAIPVLASLTFATAGQANPAAMQQARCEVASAYVAAALKMDRGHPLVFSTEQQPLRDLPDVRQWIDTRSDKQGAAPPENLIAQLEKGVARSSVAQCASVQRLLRAHHISFGKKAVAAALRFSPETFRYRADVHGVSMPTISRDGNEAVLISSVVSGPTNGGSFLQYLRRSPSGAWRVVSLLGLTVA